MSKEALKEAARTRQNGRSAASYKPLPEDNSLIDTHRPIPRAEGGTYTPDNTKIMLPTEHRDLHGNTPWLEDPALIELRAIMEDYRTCIKSRMKINNQRLAIQRGMDELTPEIDRMFDTLLDEINSNEKFFKKRAEKQLKEVGMPIIPIMQNIKGVGPISIAEIITTINITKARHASSLWKFVGYHTSSKERYKKGEKGGGHKHLRSVLFNLGSSFLRANNEDYRAVYDRRKARTEQSEKEVLHKSTRSEDWAPTAWKDVNPGRRHMDALRVMMKHFLADLWFVWRTVEGLPTSAPYVEAQLGHDTISPEERGWVY